MSRIHNLKPEDLQQLAQQPVGHLLVHPPAAKLLVADLARRLGQSHALQEKLHWRVALRRNRWRVLLRQKPPPGRAL